MVVEFPEQELPSTEVIVTPTPEIEIAADGDVTLSEQQQLILDEFGWPDSFMIMEIDDKEGNRVRFETLV